MKRSNPLFKSAIYWWGLCVIALSGGRCVICGSTGSIERPVAAHHIFFRSQTDWRYLFKVEFGCCLCVDCHTDAPDAPHGLRGNNERFLALLKTKIPERWAPIQKQLDTPYTAPALSLTKEMLKSIRADLKKRFKEKPKDSWMDADIEQEYRGKSKELKAEIVKLKTQMLPNEFEQNTIEAMDEAQALKTSDKGQ